MALLYTALAISLLLYLAECDYELPKPQYEEVHVPRYGNATLPCHFSFIENTYDLGLSWHREDIVEEIEVEDIQAYIQQTYEYKEPQLVYSFHKDKEDLSEQSQAYYDRVRMDINDIPEGDLTLFMHNVDFADEGLYTCKAISPHGKGEIKLKLLIQEEEEPPVVFNTVDNATVVRCVSKGWYNSPIVRWLNRREDDISENSTVEVLEQMKDGRHRVSSTLSGVKSHEIYRCLIRDVKKARRARTIYRRLKGGIEGIWGILKSQMNFQYAENTLEIEDVGNDIKNTTINVITDTTTNATVNSAASTTANPTTNPTTNPANNTTTNPTTYTTGNMATNATNDPTTFTAANMATNTTADSTFKKTTNATNTSGE